MPSITNEVRRRLESLMTDEVKLVQAKASKEAAVQWERAEKEVAKQLGYDGDLVRIEHLQNQIEGLQSELRELEARFSEKAKAASVKDYRDCGIDIMGDQYGRVQPYSQPTVFDRRITTVWDCLVLKHLNEQVPFFQIYVNLGQLHHAVRRELLLCGNFEDARALYQRFHEKITLAIGNELPAVLAEVQALPGLESPGH